MFVSFYTDFPRACDLLGIYGANMSYLEQEVVIFRLNQIWTISSFVCDISFHSGHANILHVISILPVVV